MRYPARPMRSGAWVALAALAFAAQTRTAHAQAAAAPPEVVAPSQGKSGPQTAAPAPLAPGAGADTPGGSARNGGIAPPSVSGDPGMNKGAPAAGTEPMPVIRPPGTSGGNDQVVPK